MNDLPEKPLSSEILYVLMGSNPQINGILRVSEHMYVRVNAACKETFTHTRLSQAFFFFDCSRGCLMSTALLYGVGSVGQEPSGSIRKSYKRGEAAAQRPRSLLFLTGATLGLRVWPQLLRISAHHSARFWYFDHSNQPLQPGSQLLVGVQRS